MSISYPENTESKYPVYMRKTAKLAHFIADDWINWKDGNDDHEWVPNLIQVDIGRHSEEDSDEFTLIIRTSKSTTLEIWFSDEERPTLDVDSLFNELVQSKDSENEDMSEVNVTNWINEVEVILLKEMDEDDIVGRFYEEGELLDKDWNENISESYEVDA